MVKYRKNAQNDTKMTHKWQVSFQQESIEHDSFSLKQARKAVPHLKNAPCVSLNK